MNMKITTSLIWTEIKQHYNLSKLKYNAKYNKKELIIPLTVIIAIAASIVSLMPLMYDLLSIMLISYASYGLTELFITTGVIYATSFGLIFGLFIIVGEFFYSKNLRVITTLPLKSWQIITGKFAIVFCDLTLISMIILIPHFVVLGIRTEVNIMFIINSFIIIFFSQIIPISLLFLATILLSRLFRNSRKKELFMFLTTIIIFSLIILSGFLYNRNLNIQADSNYIAEYLSNPDNIINQFSKIYPPAYFASKTIFNEGISSFINLLIYIFLNIIVFTGTIIIGNKLYSKTYNSLKESYSIKQDIIDGDVESMFNKSHSKYYALFKREWLYFLKVPAFSVNGFINTLILPIMLIVLSTVLINIEVQEFEFLFNYMEEFKDYGILITALLSVLGSCINGLSYSIFSREGKSNLKELKSLPFSSKEIAKTKILHVNTFSMLGMIPLTILCLIIFRFSLIQYLIAFFISLVSVIFVNNLQMIVDVINPKLDWDNPQRAMKNNMNGLYGVIISFGYVFGLGYLIYNFSESFSPRLLTFLITTINIVGIIIITKIIFNFTDRLLKKD